MLPQSPPPLPPSISITLSIYCDPTHITTSLSFTIMSSFTKTSLCFFLLCIFSPLQLQARDQLTSFSMAAQNVYPGNTATPVADVGRKQPEKLPPLGRYGYGLYGQRSPDEYYERSRPPRTVFSTAESYGSREANPGYKSYGENMKNGKYFYDQGVSGSQGYGVKDGSFGYEVYNYEGKGKGHHEINQEEYYEP